jgi:hypothetical protein
MPAPLKLSSVKPDFDSLLLQLQMYLQNTGTWVDMQTSSTGQTLLEMIAAVGTFNQFAIESAARETALTTAVRDSSIYAITRMLGVRIHRKSPSSVDVQLTRQDSSTTASIATLTQFDVNGSLYFNRHPLMFVSGFPKAAERLYYGTAYQVIDTRSFKLSASIISELRIQTGDTFKILVNVPGINEIRTVTYIGGNVGNDLFRVIDTENPINGFDQYTRFSLLKDTVRLYEGTVIEETFVADGSQFQQYTLSNRRFSVSDLDVEVRVYNETTSLFEKWSQTPDGLWISEPTDKVYFDSTSGDGEALITFGDDITGAIPKLGNEIRIKYAITNGASANNGLTNLPVALPTFNDVEGTTISVISGGADEKPSSYYRTMAPLIFKARNRGVTVSDYKAVALDYPGIISVSVQTQKDIAPQDLRWMNQVRICLLPAAEGVYYLTQAEWDDFMDYMGTKKHAAITIVKKDPTRQSCNIDVTLALKTQYLASSVAPEAEAQIRALFKRQSDTLGRRITVSDITKASIVDGVDYVVVNACSLSGSSGISDLIPFDNTHYLEIGYLTVNTKYSEREIY